MNLPKALFLDMDGTILRSDHSLATRTIRAIKSISRAGCRVCLATGRSWESVKPIYDRLGLRGPTICYNGAVVIGGPAGDCVSESTMDEGVARFVIAEVRASGCEMIAYRHRELIFERRGPEIKAYNYRTKLPGTIVDFDSLHTLEFTKVIVLSNQSMLMRLKFLLRSRFSDELLSVTFSDSRFLELMAGKIDKGRGLVEVCGILNVAKESTVAIGDGWNDLTMLEASGDAWIMGGAPQELMAKFPANRVALDANQDGAARVIEAMLRENTADERLP